MKKKSFPIRFKAKLNRRKHGINFDEDTNNIIYINNFDEFFDIYLICNKKHYSITFPKKENRVQ